MRVIARRVDPGPEDSRREGGRAPAKRLFVRPKVAGAYRKTNTGGAQKAPVRQLIAVAEDGGKRSQPACWEPVRRVENDAPSYSPITLV
jgi:hypothetical protein